MIIGLTGKMGSGKSTLIELLKEHHDAVINVKFAQPLYDMQEYIYKRIEKAHKRGPEFIKDRKLLQFLGTEWGRQTINSSLWIDLWKAEVKTLNKEYTDFITVDDVRYDNEAIAVIESNGIIIEVQSDKADQRIDTKSGISNHPSEAGISEYLKTFTIQNNGTRQELYYAFQEVLNKCVDLGIKGV